MNKKILLVGGGGHCKSVIDSLLELDQFSEIGIIDKKENKEIRILGVSVIGFDDDLPRFFSESYHYAFVTLGSIGDPSLRINLFRLLEEIGFKIPNIVDASAIVSDDVNMETGIYIGKNVVVNAGTSLCKGSIINTSATIEHDCAIGAFSHIAPGAVLCGEVIIGGNSHIGANTVIKQQIKIGANTIIGVGSVVLQNIDDDMIAYGNPCKEIKTI